MSYRPSLLSDSSDNQLECIHRSIETSISPLEAYDARCDLRHSPFLHLKPLPLSLSLHHHLSPTPSLVQFNWSFFTLWFFCSSYSIASSDLLLCRRFRCCCCWVPIFEGPVDYVCKRHTPKYFTYC